MNAQYEIMLFDAGIDDFITELKSEFKKTADLKLHARSLPQALVSFALLNKAPLVQLRFVVLGRMRDEPIGRLSWLQGGKETICCYINSSFETLQQYPHGLLRVIRKSPARLCLLALAGLRE